jgi:pSer/pThr/pTyr-binding forkhead associated (FHA) protein
MSANLVLTVISGPNAGERHVFEEPTVCVLGRSPACWLRADPADFTVSRRHCLLIVKPPHVIVQDLGSLNGTYVNGMNIGHRSRGYLLEAGDPESHTRYTLKEGDVLQVGHTCFRVEVESNEQEEAGKETAANDLRPRCTASPN